MSDSEAYRNGYNWGETSANFGEAYENASRDDYDNKTWEVPERFMPDENEKGWGQDRTDWTRGTEDGWNAHFDETEEN